MVTLRKIEPVISGKPLLQLQPQPVVAAAAVEPPIAAAQAPATGEVVTKASVLPLLYRDWEKAHPQSWW